MPGSSAILDSDVGIALRGTVGDMLEFKGKTVYSIGPRETVYEAIARMTERRIGALLVMEGERLVGIVSERDYARKVILEGRSSKETSVQEIMTRKPLTVAPASSLTECLQIVTHNSVRHLPVVQDGHVVGVLSIGDLVRAVLSQQAEIIHSLSSFIGSDYPT